MIARTASGGVVLSWLWLLSSCQEAQVMIEPTKGIGMMHNYPPLEPPADGSPPPPPAFFVRAAGSISGPGKKIVIPKALDTILYEGELVVVIGRTASRVSEAEAARCIRGYTCGMDGSPLVLGPDGARDPARSLAGKSADGMAPVGPRVVERLDPNGHEIVLRINGVEVERASTNDLIWRPARIVSEVSKTVALEPGDVIFCGARRAVPKMQPGDVVEVEISGIGVLRNEVVAEE
jgi:2-keto-4-pentenoate hydratase/2-oxohepta-3-ene-1,7-dioic acid hydratase in catechol pathway